MNVFEVMDQEIERTYHFFRHDCPHDVEDITGNEAFSESQIRYMIHLRNEIFRKKPNMRRLLEGARKHQVWGLYFKLTQEFAQTYSDMIPEVISHIHDVPEQYRTAFAACVCIMLEYRNRTMNEIMLELLEDCEDRNLSDDVKDRDYVNVYAPATYRQSPASMKNRYEWYLDVDDAMNELIESHDHDDDAANLMVTVMRAKIATKDILIEMNVAESRTREMNVIIQNDSVFDISEDPEFQEHLEEHARNSMESDSDDENIDLVLDWIEKVEEDAGIPECKIPFDLINLRLSKPEDIRELFRMEERISDGDAVRTAREIIRSNPDNGWTMVRFSRQLKEGYYKTLWFDRYERKWFAGYGRYEKIGNDISGPFGIPSDDELTLSYIRYRAVAVDRETWARTLADAQSVRKAEPVVRKQEPVVKKEVRKQEVTLSPQDIQNLKQDMYIRQMEEMYEKELEKKNAEMEAVRERLSQMQVELDKVNRMNSAARKKLEDQKCISILKAGSEPEKFDHETKAFVLKAIRHEVEHCEVDTRRHDVLKNVYEANSDGAEKLLAQKSEEIKRIVKGYRQITDIREKLQSFGFEIVKEGPHAKVRYPGDSRYGLPIAGSAGDYRAGENLAAQIRKKFF
ncbi:MAG: hypothetical protein ACI32N_08910 [Bulleidia sp.]